MHTRTATTAALLAAGLLLTACSSSSDNAPTATPPPATTAAAAPTTVPAAEQPVPDTKLATGVRTAACWKAIRDQYEPGTLRLTGEPAEPPTCLSLSTDEVSAVAEDVQEYLTSG